MVDGVKESSFHIHGDETLGRVGDSGSRLLMRLLNRDVGEIRIDSVDTVALLGSAPKPYRGVQIVFQDPYAPLNPRIGRIMADEFFAQDVAPELADRWARDLLRFVGLDPGSADHYQHEFSGGQRQRIGVAHALALEPEVLVSDEPVSTLDASIQEQILVPLDDIRRWLSLVMLFIKHDLPVAVQICDRIAVMPCGEIVETDPTANPHHPYTRELRQHWTCPSHCVSLSSRVTTRCRSEWAGDTDPIHPPPSLRRKSK